MVNMASNLSVSVLFVDDQGNRKIRTKDKVIVSLRNGDKVVGDNAVTGNISVVNSGELFNIASNGVRT